MTALSQKRLAIAAAVTGAAVFLAANAHLLAVALNSQPACAAVTDAAPAKRAC